MCTFCNWEAEKLKKQRKKGVIPLANPLSFSLRRLHGKQPFRGKMPHFCPSVCHGAWIGRKTLASLSVSCDSVHAAGPPAPLHSLGSGIARAIFLLTALLFFSSVFDLDVTYHFRFSLFITAKVFIPSGMPSSGGVYKKISTLKGRIQGSAFCKNLSYTFRNTF